MTLTLRSLQFEPGSPIPARFDHDRGDLSPALTWDGVPRGTAGLVLLVDDPDAPVEGSFVHWVLSNIDPARQGIAEGEVPAEATAGANGFGRPGYLGPAPPPGDGPHRYIFRLLAVDQPVPLKGLPSYQDVESAVTGHILAEARLTGNLPAVAQPCVLPAARPSVFASIPSRQSWPRAGLSVGERNSPARASR